MLSIQAVRGFRRLRATGIRSSPLKCSKGDLGERCKLAERKSNSVTVYPETLFPTVQLMIFCRSYVKCYAILVILSLKR